MATIKVSHLCPAGSELFQDSETFLNELTDQELDSVVGGAITCDVSVRVSIRTVSLLTRINTKTLVNTHIVSIRTHAVTVGISITQKTVINSKFPG